MKPQPDPWKSWCTALVLLCCAASAGWLADSTGGLLFAFPRQLRFSPAHGPKDKRISRKLVVVVVDGLSVEAAQTMKQLMKLSKRGATLIAQTETPSYSRVGYSAMATGAKPEVTGVSSNDRSDIMPVDSIFRRARVAGLKTALVGYAWWLELFGRDIAWASIESGWKKHKKIFYQMPWLPQKALPPGIERRLLLSGAYVPLKYDWKSVLQRGKHLDAFGDSKDTPIHEDRLRADEALRYIRRQSGWIQDQVPVDLLFVHLESPDDEGHKTGSPYSPAYLDACQVVDQGIQKIAAALDLQRDTLMITADHGFTHTVRGSGHGGWEPSATQVPWILVGAGIKKGWLQKSKLHRFTRERLQEVDQIDMASTLAVLLGLPFPSQNQGRPAWQALSLPRALVRRRTRQWKRAQLRFTQHYARALGLPLPADAWRASAAKDWPRVQQAFARAKASRHQTGLASRLLLGMAFLLVVAWLLKSLSPHAWHSMAWLGVVAWIVFELGFLALHHGLIGVYSLTSITGASKGIARLLALSAACLVAVGLMLHGGLRRFGVGELPRRKALVYRVLFLCILAKSALAFGVTGWGDLDFMPHGLFLFGAIASHVQTCCAAVLGLFALMPGPREA